MPDVKPDENEKDFMERCIPMAIEEGTAEDAEQASAICRAIFEKHMAGESKPAEPSPAEPVKNLDGDVLINFGSAVKALGSGRVGGYLVTYGDPDHTDASGERDYFDKQTDFDFEFPGKSTTYFNHCLPVETKDGRQIIIDRKLTTSELKQDEFGVWAETVLDERDAYESYLLKMAVAGKLGWSSGAPPHLVKRERVGKAHHVTRWPLGKDASLTHMPAEPRNGAYPLKSISRSLQAGWPALDSATANVPTPPQPKGGPIMADELKTLQDEVTGLKTGVASILKKLNEPALPTGGRVTDVKDLEAERPFKSRGEQFMAIKNAALNPGAVDKRLMHLKAMEIKATGASEGTGAEGGWAIQQDFVKETLDFIYTTGAIMNLVNKRAIGAGANGLVVNTINETSRADGSRFGGVQAYFLNEGGTLTASRPTMRRFALNLEKLIGLYYATDELLQDVTALAGETNDMFSKEIQFVAENRIINGLGAGAPLGILNSDATISVAKETGQPAATLVTRNLSKMWARMWAPSRATAVWLIDQSLEVALDELYVPTGAGGFQPSHVISYDTNGEMKIKGRPVVPIEHCQALGTKGDIYLADLSGYRWIDKGGVEQASSIHVQFLTDETAFRWVYRCNGAPFRVSALTPKSGGDTLGQFVTLDARA